MYVCVSFLWELLWELILPGICDYWFWIFYCFQSSPKEALPSLHFLTWRKFPPLSWGAGTEQTWIPCRQNQLLHRLMMSVYRNMLYMVAALCDIDTVPSIALMLFTAKHQLIFLDCCSEITTCKLPLSRINWEEYIKINLASRKGVEVVEVRKSASKLYSTVFFAIHLNRIITQSISIIVIVRIYSRLHIKYLKFSNSTTSAKRRGKIIFWCLRVVEKIELEESLFSFLIEPQQLRKMVPFL